MRHVRTPAQEKADVLLMPSGSYVKNLAPRPPDPLYSGYAFF